MDFKFGWQYRRFLPLKGIYFTTEPFSFLSTLRIVDTDDQGGSASDSALMRRVREDDDIAAFGEISRRYREPLRRFFAALLADSSQADDCVQETLLRLWLSRKRYEPTGKFSAYLFQIGRHYYLNQRVRFRQRARQEGPLPGDSGGIEIIAPPFSTQPERILLERREQARLRRAIAELPEHYRAVFTMSHFDGLKYAQIGCRLHIPVGTVKSRMAGAVRRLRHTLSHEE